jgi:hypothetical protein
MYTGSNEGKTRPVAVARTCIPYALFQPNLEQEACSIRARVIIVSLMLFFSPLNFLQLGLSW